MRVSPWSVLLVALGFCFPGHEADARSSLTTFTLRHGKRLRTVHLALPPTFDRAKPAPLVLALHGGGGRGKLFDQSSGGEVTRAAARRGWVVAFPDGVNKGWNDGRTIRTRRDLSRKDVDDVGFLSALIDQLHKTHNIDRTRVYAMGISNGGFMSYRLGIELGHKIAAIAPVTANLQVVHQARVPTHPMPVLIINGTKDPLVPYAGGQVTVLGQNRGRILSTPNTVAWWCRHNGCTDPASVQMLPDRDPRDGTRVQVIRREGLAPVVLYRIVGGGHTWPGGKQYFPRFLIGRVCRDINATQVIFDFFASHRRRLPTSTTPAIPRPVVPSGR